MLREVRISLIIMLSIGFLIGLAFTAVSAQQTKVFTVYWNSNHDYKVYDTVFDKFAAEHGFKLQKIDLLWPDFSKKINADFAAGTVPDLIEVPAPWVSTFASQGNLQDITQQVQSWPDSKDWFTNTWKEVSLNGRIYGVKLHNTAFALFYNKDLFRKAGLDPENPPQTLEQFKNAVEVITEKTGVPGFSFDADSQYLVPFLATSETPSLIKNDRIAIDTPSILKTLEVLQEIAKNWALTPSPGASYQAMRRAFITGASAMMISGPWDIANIKKLNPNLDYGVTMPPYPKGVEPRTLVAGTAVAIPKGAAHPAAAWELIKLLTQVNIEVEATREAGMLMPRKTWANSSVVQQNKVIKAFAKLLPYAVPFGLRANQLGLPDLTWGGDLFDAFYQNIIYGLKSPSEALNEFVAKGNKEIQNRLGK